MGKKAKEESKPAAILVLWDFIRTCRLKNDKECLATMLFALEACLSGESYELPKDSYVEMVFTRIRETAQRGLSSYRLQSARGRAGAAARHGLKVETADAEPVLAATEPTVTSVSKPQKTPVASGPRLMATALEPAFTSLCGPKEEFPRRLELDPIAATLEFTGEEPTRRLANVYSCYLRQLGKAIYTDEVGAAYSEAKVGEWDNVANRGAVLVGRLKARLPAQEGNAACA